MRERPDSIDNRLQICYCTVQKVSLDFGPASVPNGLTTYSVPELSRISRRLGKQRDLYLGN